MLYRHILSTAVFLPFILFSLAYGQGGQGGQDGQDGWGDLSLTDDPEDVAPAIKVIIDPGHGGRDLGARSPKHILEKNIILKLSKLIQQRLSGNENIDAIPTRSEDRDITVLERIKFANSSRGDLFIGLHADGGMGPRAHPIKLFICEYGQNELNKKTAEEIDSVWSSLNYPFKEQNLALARVIKRELEKTGAGREIEVESSDKLLLGGLSMPAVLIEPIDLSNPADEIRLENEVYITKISDAIAVAVEVYLQNAGKL
ncbi:MAG TPA: N-acetylmuramoyl-L-alanine amidase [Nitrospirae bacterium]|nr:N-acetylmuramoyl-L-alanine amidase [Nitrospirota bacterium]